jgi:hypothetical protein
MPFPALRPTSRSFNAGDYPIRTFRSQSGVETRILYGSRRTGAELSLSYENILDTQANDFVQHYEEVRGTFGTFDINADTRAGWESVNFNTGAGNSWRYAGPPEVSNVRPGRSTVQVSLVAVL